MEEVVYMCTKIYTTPERPIVFRMSRWDEGSWYTIPLDTEGSSS